MDTIKSQGITPIMSEFMDLGTINSIRKAMGLEIPDYTKFLLMVDVSITYMPEKCCLDSIFFDIFLYLFKRIGKLAGRHNHITYYYKLPAVFPLFQECRICPLSGSI